MKFIQRLKKAAILTENPLYNFFSLSLTVFSIGILILPQIMDSNLPRVRFYQNLDSFVLLIFFLEAILRFLSRGQSYTRSPFFWIDLFVVFPLFIQIVFSTIPSLDPLSWKTAPGMLLFQGGRVLRLIHFVQFFKSQKQFGLTGVRSPIKERVFSGTAAILFVFIILAGMAVSSLHSTLIEAQTHTRIENVRNHAQSHGIENLRNIFPQIILKIEKSTINENYEITYVDPDSVRERYLYGRDYIQLDNIVPGGSAQISFRDLYKRQLYLEMFILATGFIIILALLFSLNMYTERLILQPIEKAARVMELRLKGEEIEVTQIPLYPATEITAMIHSIDTLYQRLRARRKPAADTAEPTIEELPESSLPPL